MCRLLCYLWILCKECNQVLENVWNSFGSEWLEIHHSIDPTNWGDKEGILSTDELATRYPRSGEITTRDVWDSIRTIVICFWSIIHQQLSAEIPGPLSNRWTQWCSGWPKFQVSFSKWSEVPNATGAFWRFIADACVVTESFLRSHWFSFS